MKSLKQPARLTLALVASLLLVATSGIAQLPSNPNIKSTVKTSFDAVTSQLDPGGSLYLFLDTASWLEGLSTQLGGFETMLSSTSGMSESDKEEIHKAFGVLARIIKVTGIEDVNGVGASGILREGNLYRSRMVIHHDPGKGKGILWSMFGEEAKPLETLKYLPPSTAVAIGSGFDLESLWTMIKQEVEAAGYPEGKEGLKQLATMFEKQTNKSLDQVIASLDGPFLFCLTLDESKMVDLEPVAGKPLKIPNPGIALMLGVGNDSILEIIESSLPEGPELVRVEKPGLKMITMPLPAPPPLELRPTVAKAGDFLIVATHDALVNQMLAVKAGDQPGLTSTEEFKQLSREIELVGNTYSFQSTRLQKTIGEALKTVMAEAGGEAEMAEKLFGVEQGMFSVGRRYEEGWLMTANGSQHPGTMLLAPAFVAPTAIAAGMLLPALAKAKERAQRISCVNNMKQIGLAARIYASDHDELYPKDYLSMKDELVSPKILVCPSSSGYEDRAASWEDLDPDKITYIFVSPGANTEEPTKVVFRCPVHNNVGYADGSVHQE